VAEPDQNTTIISQLATITEGMAGIRRDLTRQDQAFELERQDSHLSRKELHEKVNGAVENIASMGADIKIAAAVTAQTREALNALKKTVEDAAPTIADMQTAKRVGVWLLGGGGAALIGLGLAALAWGEQFKAAILHWLGLGK
jgi:hypothetical protein